MAEMTRRERIMAAAYGKPADKLPFFHYWRHCQVGWAERECRNRGMGMNWLRPPYTMTIHGVEIVESQKKVSGQTIYRRTFNTPVGKIYYDEIRPPGVGQWHAQRGWKDIQPWQTDRLIKGPDDYKALKYIIDHTEYKADYFPIEQAMDWLGEDGVVMDALPHSPMQMLMIHWVGSEAGRFFYHYTDYPDLIEEVYESLCKSREPLYDIAAKSPAPITLCGDNIDGVLVNPKLFEKYFMPVYENQAKILHAHGKLMAVHMDGRLSVLTHLISKTPIDIIEAFHPPPMGDLSLEKALSLWKNKTIWIGYPGSVYELGPEATKKHMLSLLREAGTGERLAVAMSTENIVSNENLRMLTAVLEKAELPLTHEHIDNIERSLENS
ncbi:MAG: hypothetical protein JRH18_07285 [Deltaproteobacteria bacterium]|nr:hypothetical protein [Deltaproteobacteria bacterium]MBW2151456.1 hypothetical protein [Deltaproteobacteria bacterium]